MTTQPAYGKIWWSIVAIYGVLNPAVILNVRQRVMSPHLELSAFEFLPLSGVVHGYNPHLFYRIMHDLTHPVLLLGYALVFAGLGLWPIFGQLSERASRLSRLRPASFSLQHRGACQ